MKPPFSMVKFHQCLIIATKSHMKKKNTPARDPKQIKQYVGGRKSMSLIQATVTMEQ